MYNQITEITDELYSCKSTLKNFDISYNKIKYTKD